MKIGKLARIAVVVWLVGLGLAQLRAADRPNILFILTDDQRWDTMGCAGNPIIQTPNMDALARFENAFVTTAICMASRASIVTGIYERTFGYCPSPGKQPIPPQYAANSYPMLLKKAGYHTGFVGKFGFAMGEARANAFDSFKEVHRSPYWKPQPDGTLKHTTDIEGDAAIAFLDTVKPGQPFCLSVSFNAPHAEDGDPQQYFWQHECDNLYENATIPVPKTMTDEFFNAEPEFLRKSMSRARWHWRFDEPAKYQRMTKGYYKMISGVDMVIGRIREALAKRGLADNTVIIFTGDNGYFLGERGFADKWYIYEPSVRVPLVVYDPRIKEADRGRVLKQMALNVDFAPTILELAGVPVPKLLQGRSLCPLLKGQAPADWRTDFFYDHLAEYPTIPKSEGVRTARYTYVRWFEQKPVVEELYDHEADFDEIQNLATDPKHADLLAQLRQRTTQLRDQYGGPFVSKKDEKGKGKDRGKGKGKETKGTDPDA